MKIKSVTDVITNSSTEVFVMKKQDYLDAMEDLPWFGGFFMVNSFDEFLETMLEGNGYWERDCQGCDVDDLLYYNMPWTDYENEHTKALLREFDVPMEKLEEKIRAVKEEWKEKVAPKLWKKLFEDKVYGMIDKDSSKPEKLDKWMKENERKYIERDLT